MWFLVSLSIKLGDGVVTYAQKVCCDAIRDHLQANNRYQTHSAAKLLIHMGFFKCFFYGQASESLDLQGLQPYWGNLSTKLSTEKLNICKAPLNQALSVFFACNRLAMLPALPTFHPAT
jgi:hypothetical protein